MNTQGHNKEMGDLFRSKLEHAEVIPDPSVGVNLMRRVARQEFLRFDPLRFNVYYIGAILVAGITAGILFFPGGTETAQINTPPAVTIIIDSLTPADNVSTEQPAIEKTDEPAPKVATRQEAEAVLPSEVAPKEDQRSLAPTDSAKPAVVQNETEKSRQSEKVVEFSKYQEGFRTVVPKMTYTRKNSDNAKDNAVNADTSVVRKDDSKAAGKAKNEKNEPFAKASVTEGCAPLKVVFESLSAEARTSRWTVNDRPISENRNSEYTFSEPGKYVVSLDQEKSDGTIDSTSIVVTVFPQPEARFETSRTNINVGEAVSFRNISAHSVSWKWDFGDGTESDIFAPVHKYMKEGSYNIALVVTSANGCKDTIKGTRTVVKK